MKKPTPNVVLFYAVEDDWLARGIAEGIEEKEFHILLKAQCVNNGNDVWQKIAELADDFTYFFILLTPRSVKKLSMGSETNEDKFSEPSKRGRLVPIIHGLNPDDFPAKERSLFIRKISKEDIFVHVIEWYCDVDPLVKHIRLLERDSTHTPAQSQSHDSSAPPKPSHVEHDAQFITNLFLSPSNCFQINKKRIVEDLEWKETRIESAISWLKTRGLVRVENDLVIGNRRSIDCFSHILFLNTLKREGITRRLIRPMDNLLLMRERFQGKIYNDKGSFEIMLTASADRSGRMKFDVESMPRLPKMDDKLLFVHDGNIKLECTSIINKSKGLVSQKVSFRCDIKEDPVPICLNAGEVTITHKAEYSGDAPTITFCLSEFDCSQINKVLPCPLGSLIIAHTYEDTDKSRTNERITATLAIVGDENSKKDLAGWKLGVPEFMKRLLAILEFAQGGKLFCPITEFYSDGVTEATFISQGRSASQFMPIIGRSEDLETLISKVIEKQNLKNKWDGILDAIDFLLSAHEYNKARLSLNLIAIEKLVKTLGGEGKNLSQLECFMRDRSISRHDIEENFVKKLVDNRNALTHEGKLGCKEEEFPQLLALSHEILTRIILYILDFQGFYCSYACEKGARDFPNCEEVTEVNVPILNVMSCRQRWQFAADREASHKRVHFPS